MRARRVLIAGAGLAGLTAARELARAGAAITILDARDRIGGRVWTVRDRFADGQFGELGGEFIDDDHRRMRAMASEFGLELVRVLRGGFVQRLHAATGAPHIVRERGWDALSDAFAPLVRRYTAHNGAPDAEATREISSYSVRDWLRRVDAPRELHAFVDAFRGFFLADPDDLSALPLVQLLASGTSPAQKPVLRIVGGNGELVDALARAANARILLNHHVRRIDNAVDRAIVHVTDDRGLLQELEADAVVVTLPASTLRDVEFSPALPEEQWHAITSLRYGCATKVIVQHGQHRFSRRRARAFATDGPLGAFWDSTEGQTSRTHALLTFLAGGSSSARLQALTAQGSRALLANLCWLDLANAAVASIHTHAWEHDPLARGGYAYLDPAFDSAWLPLLATRCGRLHFAGEHTSEEHAGYMEGAVESGLRVAGELR